MEFTIRQATKKDVDVVPELMLQAMEEIVFTYIEKQDIIEAIDFLSVLFQQERNLYSFDNTFVAVNDDDDILGSITAYDGDHFETLREPVLKLMQTKYNNSIVPEKETQGGEYYLDTVAVSPLAQGNGIGSALIKHAIDYAKTQGHAKVALLVDTNNPDAQKLYERIGFIGNKTIELLGDKYIHMTI